MCSRNAGPKTGNDYAHADDLAGTFTILMIERYVAAIEGKRPLEGAD